MWESAPDSSPHTDHSSNLLPDVDGRREKSWGSSCDQ